MISGILAIGTARPGTVHRQQDLRSLFVREARTTFRPESLALVEQVFDPANGVESRALACEHPVQLAGETLDAVHERYRRVAVDIGSRALQQALDRATIAPGQLAGLVCCTCTGYLCPGLTSYLAESLRLQPAIRVFDLVGMGCAASLPSLDLASQMVQAAGPVAVVAAEVCSATVSFDEEPGLIVSNALFADGAAAAIVDRQSAPAIELLGFASTLRTEYRDLLRFRQSQGRLKNCLHRDVPVLAAHVAGETIDRLLQEHGVSRRDIHHWAVHPGGKRVLEKFAGVLHISTEQLGDSYKVLRECGNMSSPSVLFVLQSLLQGGAARPGELGLCVAFGAGFSCHAALFRVGAARC